MEKDSWWYVKKEGKEKKKEEKLSGHSVSPKCRQDWEGGEGKEEEERKEEDNLRKEVKERKAGVWETVLVAAGCFPREQFGENRDKQLTTVPRDPLRFLFFLFFLKNHKC